MPRGDSKRLGHFNLTGTDGDPFIGGVHIDEFFVIDPAFDAIFGDAQPDAIPASIFKVDELGGFVFGSVHAIKAGDADERAAPAASDEAAAGVLDRNCQAAEEIRAANAHGVERDFVIDVRNGISPVEAGEGIACREYNQAEFASDLAMADEVGLLPAF